LQDITAPLKAIWGPAYKKLEERFIQVIAIKFDLDPARFKEVKPYDIRAVEIEHAAFQCGRLHEWWTEAISYNMPGSVYGPEHAESFFISTFYNLFGSAYINTKTCNIEH
jgi:hypothetical protein